jgi:hypothetical protein
MAVIIASCWALLLTHGDAQVQWSGPVVMTYVIVGLLPFKIAVVRSGYPLPSERAEEYYRWADAQRRYSLRLMDGFFRWFSLVILAGYALQHGWATASTVWFRWLVIGIAIAVWLAFVGILIRGSGRLAVMGHGLRPAGRTPFRSARLLAPGLATLAVWYGGLVLLIVFFRR